MGKKRRKFFLRTATGLVYVVAVVGCTLWGPLPFGVLFALLGALTADELLLLVRRGQLAQPGRLVSSVATACLFFAVMGCATRSDGGGAYLFLPYIGLMIFLFISELYLRKDNPLGSWAYAMLSQVYVALPFALLNYLAFHRGFGGVVSYQPLLPLSVFVFIWLSDTGAYCVGTLFGRHHLFPRVSPQKSWEGSIGGGVLALLGAWVFAHYCHFLGPWQWFGLCLVVVVFATWGDLVESLLKRQLGLKDSGHVLPGHGGWLDRMDSMLLAVPAAVAYLCII